MSRSSIDAADRELWNGLKQVLPADKAEAIYYLLEACMNSRMEYLERDILDQVNKRGNYDPDY